MRPRSVAIVGVSAKPGSAGRVVLELLHNNKFGGPIYVVGRSTADIEGHKVLTSIDEIPENVDLAVLTLPAASVREAVEGCVRRKVKAAVIFASGFAEVGSDGNSEQDRIGAIARAGGLALVGPNCLGLMNFVDGFAAVFFSPAPIKRLPEGTRGAVAIVAQSGGLGNHLEAGLEARGVPVSCWISTGNEAGLGLADFIQYLLDDPVTQVITLYAEDIRRPQEFIDIAGEAMRRGKPIVMLHPGRGAKAKEAARSHTGALTGDHAAMRTLVEHAGVVVVDNLDELMDVSEILARFPKPSKGDLGILTFSGAFCGIAYDFCEDIGVHLPPLSRETLDQLTPILPAFLPPKNPLDLGTQTIQQPDLLQTCAEALLRDPAIGGLLISIPATSPRHSVIYVEGIAAASKTGTNRWRWRSLAMDRRCRPTSWRWCGKTTSCCRARRTAPCAQWAKLSATETAILRWRRAKPRLLRRLQFHNSEQARSRNGWARKCLPHSASPLRRANLRAAVEAAVTIADRIGYPVAMKAQAAKLAHKTEAGGVMLGVANAQDVRRAWKALHDNVERAQPGLKLDGVLVEVMSPRGLELVIGARRDPRWGPVVMVGLGGIWVEALGDVRLMPPDLSEAEIIGELRKLKTAKLLEGFRGSPPVDVNAVAAAAAAIGRLMRARPDITEVDINPLMVHAAGRGATALDALIITAGAPTHS